MPWLTNFGDLYHGTLKDKAWIMKFVETKQQLLADMFGALTDPDVIQNVDFKLNMVAAARVLDRWLLPGIINVLSNRLQWATGHSRLIGSGLNWKDPWHRMDHLVFVPHGEDLPSVQSMFSRLEKIQCDQALRQCLADAVDTEHTVSLQAKFSVDQKNRTTLILQSIATTAIQTINAQDRLRVESWKQWRAGWQDQPLSIRVRCLDLKTITDSSGSWRLHHIGAPAQDLITPAQMSMFIYKDKQTTTDNDGFDLYHFDTTGLDLAEFFLQIDTEHTVFHSADWRTILVQPGPGFKCREVSVSRL
jgi:hypothetical protein